MFLDIDILVWIVQMKDWKITLWQIMKIPLTNYLKMTYRVFINIEQHEQNTKHQQIKQ